ncbi:helix-turn-helix transcriptional regulator [Alcanivorax sediminis]|uniref:HTH luxR-type domain-containing protein n=1 Tax=Alcanivorax sediminis TaxID=2663008 RepID=A0A6N7LP26_9GAMM|nr:helix-turn-helix transcriptional regulator [Alcanivorax sediminis]MQX51693.1 hypothetical protein [Alcanivorax sediminis]
MTSIWQGYSDQALYSCINSLAPWHTDRALQALLELARRTLNADSTGWLIAFRGDYGRDTPVIELLDSWKVMDVAHNQLTRDEYWTRSKDYQALATEKGELDPLTLQAIEHTGQHRCHRLSQLGDDDDAPHWVRTEHFSRFDIHDRLLGIHHLHAGTESYLIANRDKGSFGDHDSQSLLALMKTFPRLHYWLMLERGLADQCERPLSPRQRQLVHLLLQPLGKTEVAERMGLAQSTVHSYTMALYRNFNVSSRPELMSLWLASADHH